MASNQSDKCFFLFNPDFDKVHYRYTTNFVTSILNGIFSPVALLGNFAVLFIICRTPWLREPSNRLLGCLSVSDILVGVIVQPSYVAFRLGENLEGFVPCAVRIIYSTSFYVCYGVSFLSLNAISCERYLALALHVRYKELVTKRRILMVAVLIWTLNTFLTCLQFAGINAVVRAIHLSFWFTCLLTSGILQFKIVGIVIRHHDDIRRQEIQLNSHGQSYRRQLKVAVNIAYIVGIYVFFNLPVLVVTAYHQVVHGNLSSYNYYSWAETVALLNSSLNPLVCCWRNRHIRKSILKLISSWLNCNTSNMNRNQVARSEVSGALSGGYDFRCVGYKSTQDHEEVKFEWRTFIPVKP